MSNYDPYETQRNLDAFQRQQIENLTNQRAGGYWQKQPSNVDWGAGLFAFIIGLLIGRR